MPVICPVRSSTHYKERHSSTKRILKILGLIIAVAVIGYMALGILGIGMIIVYGQVDSYTLGVLTRHMLTYGAIAAGAVVVIVKLVKSMRRIAQPVSSE